MSQLPHILALDTVDSTNAEARRQADTGERGPVWITALTQTAGRGRRGRDWETPVGNLAATLLFTTDKSPAEAAQVSFVAALAAWDLATWIVGEGSQSVQLKWPNDLIVAGGKAAGILVESGALEGGRLWLAVGMGFNLVAAPPPAPDAAIAPIAFADVIGRPPPEPLAALERLAATMERWLGLWSRGGFAPIAEAWTKRAQGLGGPCVARLPRETVTGTAEGLDGDGALRLRLADGAIRRITAGDVFFG